MCLFCIGPGAYGHGIEDYLLKHIPHYMIPSHYKQVKTIPLMPNGKLDISAYLQWIFPLIVAPVIEFQPGMNWNEN